MTIFIENFRQYFGQYDEQDIHSSYAKLDYWQQKLADQLRCNDSPYSYAPKPARANIWTKIAARQVFFDETANTECDISHAFPSDNAHNSHESGDAMAAAAAVVLPGIEVSGSAMAAAAAVSVSDATGSAQSSWKPTLRPQRVIAFEAD